LQPKSYCFLLLFNGATGWRYVVVTQVQADCANGKYHLGAPLVTQSDPGTENYNIAYAHTFIRHALDTSLEGTIQHQWIRTCKNVKPKAAWWRLRAIWVPGFEEMLEIRVVQQWYNTDNITDRY
jgi:hypothetical protein